MAREDIPEMIFEEFQEIILKDDKLETREFLDSQNISDVVELVYEFPQYSATIISIMSVHRAASVFKMLDFSNQKDIIEELPPSVTAELLNELPADDRTSFLEELPSNVVKELIRLLKPEERKITLSLLGYPESSVGRLMTPDYIAVQVHWTIEKVLSHIRKVGKESETIDVIYVTDENGVFLDDLRIREVILSSPNKVVGDIIDQRFIALNVHEDQEVAIQTFKMNNRVALPVIDDSGILLGIVTIDDVLWVTNEEFSEDMQKMGGTEALTEPYLDTPILSLFKKRVVWLFILFLGEMLTATAMGYFEDEIAKAVVLSLFIPLLISSGGNSGSQASTLIIQAMAVGEVTISDWWKILKRELISGLMLGFVLGFIGFARVILWNVIFNSYGEHTLDIGYTIGFSLLGIVLWGTITGSMLPLLLKRLGADPATSSAPFVATLVDVTGLVIYFSTAYFFLKGTLL